MTKFVIYCVITVAGLWLVWWLELREQRGGR